MSNQVSNAQIEDVLSSIRRLVAEEVSQNPMPERPKEQPEAQKLVLNPTQKIQLDVAETGADLWADTADLSPEETERQWWQRSEQDPVIPKPFEEQSAESKDFADEEALTEATVQADEGDVAETTEVVPANRLEGALAELEAALSRQETEFEPPEGEDEYNGGLEMAQMPWPDMQAEEQEAEAATEVAEEAPEETAEVAVEELVMEEQAVEAEAEVVDEPGFVHDPHQRLFAHAAQEPEDQQPSFQHYAPEETELFDSEPEYRKEASTGADLDPAALVDQDALRELVSEIVRQELQGSLGERITRNVRKLVRREIHRALLQSEAEE